MIYISVNKIDVDSAPVWLAVDYKISQLLLGCAPWEIGNDDVVDISQVSRGYSHVAASV